MTTFRTPMPDAILYTRHDTPDADALRLVDEGLGRYNDAAAPLHEVRPLAAVARLPSGQVAGGAVGRTWGRCCELQQLWVEPALRRQGIGARLVREFEAAAAARGCDVFYLESFSFQAPSLYRSLGYAVKLELSGFAPGVTKYVMVREARGGRHG